MKYIQLNRDQIFALQPNDDIFVKDFNVIRKCHDVEAFNKMSKYEKKYHEHFNDLTSANVIEFSKATYQLKVQSEQFMIILEDDTISSGIKQLDLSNVSIDGTITCNLSNTAFTSSFTRKIYHPAED